MKPDIEVIHKYMTNFFKEEFLKYCLFLLLAIVAILASIYGFKIYAKKTFLKAIVIVLLTSVCAVSLVLIKTIEFIPVYKDYKNMSYTIECNSRVCFQEGMNNLFEQKNLVEITTKKGNKLNLKITNDYKFQTEYIYTGTIIYTNVSKHIVWYDLS